MSGKGITKKFKRILALVMIFSILQNHFVILGSSAGVAYAAINSSIEEISEEESITSEIDTSFEFEDVSADTDLSVSTSNKEEKDDEEILKNTIEETKEEQEILEDTLENTIVEEDEIVEEEIIENTVDSNQDEVEEREVAEEVLEEEICTFDFEILDVFKSFDGLVVRAKGIAKIDNIKENVKSSKIAITIPELEKYTFSDVYVEEVKNKGEEIKYADKVSDNALEINISEEVDAYEYEYVIVFVYEGVEDVTSINTEITIEAEYENYDLFQAAGHAEEELKVSEKNNNTYDISAENKNIYKGYLYANAISSLGYETEYTSIDILRIDSVKNIDTIIVSEEADKIITKENKEVSLLNLNQYTKTLVKKEDFDNMLGVDGYIEIYSDGKALGRIDKNTKVDGDYFVYEYESNVSLVEFRLNNVLKTGTIEILNKKVIRKTTAFDINRIKTFDRIETNVNVKEVANVADIEIVLAEVNNKLEIKLEETESKIDFNISTSDLATYTSNEVTMSLTLKTNEEKYELFKNPVIDIELPSAITDVNIKNVDLMYKNGLTIESWNVEETQTGSKVIKLKLSGVQDEYKSDETVEGTTIILTTELGLERMTANGEALIKVKYSNEVGTHTSYENSGKDADEYLIKYVSRSGILKSQKLELDGKELLTNYEDETQTATINVDDEEKTAKITMAVMNNYKTYISNLEIIGKIPFVGNKKDDIDLNTTFDTTLNGPVTLNGLLGKVYYSVEENPELNSSSWTEEVEDYSKVKTFKVVLENENVYLGEKVELSYELNIPEKVGYNASAYNLITTYYYLNTEQIVDSSMVGLVSEVKATDLEDCQTIDLDSLISVGTQVTRGNEVVEEGDIVYEGQILRYNVVLTNNSSEEINDIRIKGNAENANMYYWNTYSVISTTTGEEALTGEWKEDVDGEHIYDSAIFESLKPGETKTFSYQVKVKHMNELAGENVYGKIIVSANEMLEKEYTTIESKIEDADIELVTTKTGEEEITKMIILSNENYKVNVTVANIADRDLENVEVNVFLPSLINYNNETTYLNDYDLTCEETSTGSVVKIKLDKLAAGEKRTLYLITTVGALPLDVKTVSKTILATVDYDNKHYISNDYTREITQSESYINVNYYSNIEDGSKVNDGDKVNYTLELVNMGVISKYVHLNDVIPYGIKVNSVQRKVGNNEVEELSLNDKLLTSQFTIAPKETVKITIDGVVDSSDLRTEQSTITNEPKFLPGSNIDVVDEITFYITPRESVKSDFEPAGQEVIKKEDVKVEQTNSNVNTNRPSVENNNNSNNNNIETNSSNNNITNNQTNNNQNNYQEEQEIVKEVKYSVSGKVWLDADRNGLYGNEKLLEEIKVGLYKMSDDVASIKDKNLYKTTTTSSNGEYTFSDVEKGKYIVVFTYDNAKYEISPYKVSKKNITKTSNVIEKELTLVNKKSVYGVSDLLEIMDSSVSNLNMGLMEASKFDMSVTSYIKTITIENSKGKEVKDFSNDEKLVKIEIDSKELKKSKVTVEYVITVKNEGKIAGYINQISDYLPNGFNFDENQNNGWYLAENNNLYNSSLNKQKLNPNESREITLILTKQMDEEATGVYKNIAKITDSTNNDQILDTNKTNDTSSMELIISVRTGAIAYVTTMILILGILIVALLIVSKLLEKDEKKAKLVRKVVVVVGIIIAIIFCLVIRASATIYIENLAGNYGNSNDYSLSSYYGISFSKGMWYYMADSNGTNRMQCIHGLDISDAPAYKGTSERAITSIADIIGDEYSTNSYVGSASGDDSVAAGLAYLCARSEEGGLSKSIFGGILHSYESNIEDILNVSVSTGSDLTSISSSNADYKKFVEIVNSGDAGTAEQVEKQVNTNKVKYTKIGGSGVFGPCYVTFPKGKTKLYISTNSGASYSEYTGSVILDNGTSTTFGDACYDNKFYIPESAFAGVSNFNTIRIKIAGDTEAYRGRIMALSFKGTGQNQIILRGDKTEDESEAIYEIDMAILVDKSISNTTESGSFSRAGMSNSAKAADPVNVAPDEEVTYTITVTNQTGTARDITITDEFETKSSSSYGGLSYLPSTGWSVSGNKATYTVKNLANGASESVTLKLLVNLEVTEPNLEITEIYENVAVATCKVGSSTLSSEKSEDYVIIKKSGIEEEEKEESPEPKGTLLKYITSAGGSSVADRSTLSNGDKYQDPVLVDQGDSVVYTVKITNPTAYDVYNVDMTDTIETAGLRIDSISPSMDKFSIDAGGEQEFTVRATVTASNLYLYNLGNDVQVTHAEYTKVVTVRHRATYTIKVGDKTKTVTRTWISYEYYPNTPISVANFNDPNGDQDYVRLREFKIGGTVWLDNNGDGIRQGADKGISGIPVRLKEIGTGTYNNVKDTDGSGNYEFDDFYKGTNFKKISGCSGYYPYGASSMFHTNSNGERAEHRSYQLEYEYDGVKYTSTKYAGKTNLNSDNSPKTAYATDSNAQELSSERRAFDDSLETITYNQARNSSGSTKDLAFDKSGHVSTWKWTPATTMKSYSFCNGSSIDKLFLSPTGSIAYLTDIDLGLVEREKVDLKITKDFESAEVRVNKHKMIYDYAALNHDSAFYERSDVYNVYLYRSDYDYRISMYENAKVRQLKAGTELEVDLTYKIKVHNTSPDTTYVRINEIVDYHSDSMKVKSVTSKAFTNIQAHSSTAYNVATGNTSGFSTVFLRGNEASAVIPTGGEIEIIIVYEVLKNDGAIILGRKDNIAQISAYSTYTNSSGNVAKGLIDIDSNAGNVAANTNGINGNDYVEEYEDNTFRVNVNLVLKDVVRQITGMVFEDARSEEIVLDKNIRQFMGNGVFGSGPENEKNGTITNYFENALKMTKNNQDLVNDTPLDGMTVELIEVIEDSSTGILYEETIEPSAHPSTTNVVVETAGSDGKYTLSSFIPGTYIVRFRYGNIYKDTTLSMNSLIHNGQDYKSTAYVLTGASGVLESTDDDDTKYNALVAANNSDARDNELRRIEVMAYSEIMTNDMAEKLKYTNYVSKINNVNDQDLKDFIGATNCFADTVTFTLGVENKSDITNVSRESIADSLKELNTIAVYMPNVDYGLTFRPENYIEINKKIKSMKLVTSAGETLVNIEYDKDTGEMTKNIGAENVQSVDNSRTTQGFRYINVDEEILQGATISVEYYLVANNIGEVDTVNKTLINEGYSKAVLTKLKTSKDVLIDDERIVDNYSNVSKIFETSNLTTNYKYGDLVGDIYYRGKDASTTEIAIVPVTVNKILDFIDNDAAFVASNNQEKDKFWKITTEAELISEKLINLTNGSSYLDNLNRMYTTVGKNNLVINTKTESENPNLLVPIIPEFTGVDGEKDSYIVIQIDDVLSGDADSSDMAYDNVAEIVEFTTPVGRRTNFASTIGNILLNGTKDPFEAAEEEVDTDCTEVVRLTPPTGITRVELFVSGNTSTIIIMIVSVVAIFIIYVLRKALYGRVGKSKFYK